MKEIIKKIALNLPAQLILSILVGVLLAPISPANLINTIFTLSCLLKDVLMLFLPFLITAYIWTAIGSFGNKGVFFIISTFVLIVVANLLAVFESYTLSSLFLPHIIDPTLVKLSNNTVQETVLPYFKLSSIESLYQFQPKYGMILGSLLGLFSVFLHSNTAKKMFKNSEIISSMLMQKAFTLRSFATMFLKKGFIPFLPLYVLGFVLKIRIDGDLSTLLHGYAHTFALIVVSMFVHLFFWYWVGSSFNIKSTIQSIKNMLPAGITGFTTISSSATLPVTLEACEKNIKNRSFVDFFVPATVNAHLTGDSISIIMTGIALLLLSGGQIPSLTAFTLFALNYSIVKFSSAGVPGGGVIVILPVVKEYFGLDDAATTLLQTIYILQDPFLTSSNVMGNGAFAIVSHKLIKPFLKNETNTVDPITNTVEESKSIAI